MNLIHNQKKIEIRDSLKNELILFQRIEAEDDTKNFIIPYTYQKHLEEYDKPEIVYKTIVVEKTIVGFIILRLEEDRNSVEFRRIVIKEKGKGYGKMAINILDTIVKNEYKRNRIWLDVFSHNERGIHIYEKCGYIYQNSIDYQGKKLKIYEKIL